MKRGDYYLRSDRAHLRIEWFPDDGDDPENPTTRNPEITMGSRHFWVTMRSTQCLRDSRWWNNLCLIPLFSESMHNILIGVFFFSIDLMWWRRDTLGWMLRNEKTMSRYDAAGDLVENKPIPWASRKHGRR